MPCSVNRQGILNLLNQLDASTYNHSIRVMLICQELERYLGLKDNVLSQAGLLHDIGKIYISGRILNKPGSLTGLEREIIDLHAYIGYTMLHSLEIDEKICRIVLYHHGEYPPVLTAVEDLKLDGDILYKANLLRAIDVYEALTSDRPYHCAVKPRMALEVMMRDGSQSQDVLRFIASILGQKDNYNGAVLSQQYIRPNMAYALGKSEGAVL